MNNQEQNLNQPRMRFIITEEIEIIQTTEIIELNIQEQNNNRFLKLLLLFIHMEYNFYLRTSELRRYKIRYQRQRNFTNSAIWRQHYYDNDNRHSRCASSQLQIWSFIFSIINHYICTLRESSLNHKISSLNHNFTR
ncbi:hypothetical protein DERP_011385 [Dermatophagoides pteronyssinus]|uniref:Transmembrane protein n=1 Tax=Dermatophagoides pteronyssinus TaxID=6956 RepID=A0ABQ8J5M6_DERPT|nr:hypothetical protein DERP_011385 [Dermatophagoides pteronyssinus]